VVTSGPALICESPRLQYPGDERKRSNTAGDFHWEISHHHLVYGPTDVERTRHVGSTFPPEPKVVPFRRSFRADERRDLYFTAEPRIAGNSLGIASLSFTTTLYGRWANQLTGYPGPSTFAS